MQKIIVRKLFQVNYVILDYQAVTPLLYHLILLLEFLQLLFFIFYNINFVNEFRSQNYFTQTSVDLTLVATNSTDNSTSSSAGSGSGGDSSSPGDNI